MQDLATRLAQCFAVVFPDLPPAAIAEADQSQLDQWDSVASITLVTVIEEEFQRSIDMEKIPELNSFAKIAAYLGTQR